MLYDGVTPDGLAFISIVGSKTELMAVDVLSVPMRIQMRIGRQDGRCLGIGFHTGIGVPQVAWISPLTSPDPSSEGGSDSHG